MRTARFIAIAVLVLGCSEEFNPVAEGPRPYVVFALMNTGVPTQIIRVHETAPPEEQNPGHPPVPGTTVRITGPEGIVDFRDTVLTPPPGSVDTATVTAFVAEPFVPTRGGTYTLSVISSRGNATATITVPYIADITTNDFFVVRSPYSYPAGRTISLQSLLSQEALGFVIRFVIEYERLVGAVWVTETIEVPRAYMSILNEYSFEAEYPRLSRRSSLVTTSTRAVRDREGVTFLNSTYLQTLSILYARYGKDNLRMKQAMFILTQADVPFFTYYSYANFFQDKLSIRVDQPDYSNVNGALGFFGSMTSDTTAFPLPSDLSPPLIK